jgi:uncharacterized protein (DUF362 family)
MCNLPPKRKGDERVVTIVCEKRSLRTAIRRVLERWAGVIDPAREVFLKPNIVFPVRQASGEITRLEVVRVLIEEIRRIHPRISVCIGEGPAAGSIPEENFRISGFTHLARAMNVALIDLHSVDREEVPWDYGTVALPKVVLEDTYISLPILKPSSAAGISGALKNQKGIIPVHVKKEFHKMGLDAPLASLNAAVKPDLTVMDCSLFFGREVLVAGDNCGEIDAAVCRLLGIEEPSHVRLSRERGVCRETYEVEGDEIAPTDLMFRPSDREPKSIGRMRLWANPRACSMCRYLFRDIRAMPTNLNALAIDAKLLRRVMRGAEIVMGSEPAFRRESQEVICVGECTRRLAERNGYTHVPGCPPTARQLRKSL